MNTVLLTGFGTFGDYKANSTELVARKSEGSMLADWRVHTHIFETVVPKHDRALELYTLARRLGATRIVSLGMASQKRSFCLETLARNWVDCSKYCSTQENGKPIDESQSYGVSLSIDYRFWDLQAFQYKCLVLRLPSFEYSSNPGGFCCNHLLWQLRAREIVEKENSIPFLFLHVPCTPECVADEVEFKQAGKICWTVTEIVSGLAAAMGSARLNLE
jgi:pyrrolidone-carboxylate peptidase